MSTLLSPVARIAMVVLTLGILLGAPARVDAITLQEILDLNRAGVGDEVLLALIEVDQRVFPIDPATLKKLKQSGLSERVIVAIVKSGRMPAPAPDAPDALQQQPVPP